ncbi:MAG: alpha/beta hydrolase [Pseudomonadota bacterium]
MRLTSAPLYTDVRPGPDGGQAHWLNTSDGLRIRMGHWTPKDAGGTVLMFPGRTEYVEKYAVVAQGFHDRGYATVAIDWRGQGLADRMLDDGRIGHVDHFMDYQDDVQTVLDAVRALGLPEPYYLMAHSMGGCIGLRALHEGLPVVAAAFTGPMWGIRIKAHMQPLAWVLPRLMPAIGQGHALPPSTKIDPYVLTDPFEDNLLTTDEQMWDMMADQLRAHDELRLGGPSFVWLRSALDECNALARLPAPPVPAICFQGSNERIVHQGRIAAQMAKWPEGDLRIIDGGEHEVLMENDAVRGRILSAAVAKFEARPFIAAA